MFRTYRDTIRTANKPVKPAPFEVYNCDMCTTDWVSENDVEIHRKSAHHSELCEIKVTNERRFCTICMRLQNSDEDLISHIKQRHLLSSPDAQRIERKIYICNFCSHIFFNKDLLAVHIIYAHLTTKGDRFNVMITCPKCFERIQLKSIWFHFQKHNIPSLSLCDICLSSFLNQEELVEHLKTHPPYYSCEPCSYHCNKGEQYKAHLKSHKDRFNPRPAKSRRNMFNNGNKISIYRYNIHNATRGLILPYFMNICILCREICTSKEEMAQHASRDHYDLVLKKIRHICACGDEFEFRVMLKQHVHKLKGDHRPAEMSSSETVTAVVEETSKNVSVDGTSAVEDMDRIPAAEDMDRIPAAEDMDRIPVAEDQAKSKSIEVDLTPTSEVCIANNFMN